ncbi:hypothetical protein UPYG_G00182600 [Umbra pygmaea]|uniref:Uncharacterized protein n=1 Tax=Umbra pygmaea TaxID=75934 RepID=A0ABD0WQY8_UMBPY
MGNYRTKLRKAGCAEVAINGGKMKMDQTFPLRRREIVEAGPLVKILKERWPALFPERQFFAEFNRIAMTNLENYFFGAVDCYTPCFVTIFKSKKGSVGEKLAEIVQLIDSRKPNVTAVHPCSPRPLCSTW